MVAYSFQEQFVQPILEGTKVQTIRANGKRRHARPGERLQLFTGMRTKHCKKIIDDPVCSAVFDIRIVVGRSAIKAITLDAMPSMPMGLFDAFAKRDGFADVAAMHDFWRKTHGVGVFRGKLIRWDGAQTYIENQKGAPHVTSL